MNKNLFFQISASFFVLTFGAILTGCANGFLFSMAVDLPSKKVQNTEELLQALKEGLQGGRLGDAEFYKGRIGYKFSKFPKDTADAEDFSYDKGEAIEMDEGEFKGERIGIRKWVSEEGDRVLNIDFTTPGCLKKWQVERIFMEQLQDVRSYVLFSERPVNWPETYKISRRLKEKEQIIFFSIGEQDGCLLDVVATEVYK